MSGEAGTRGSPRATPPARGQRGAALLVALVLLIGVTLISLATVSTSTMELRMAGNSEFAASTFQRSLAAIDFTIADSNNLPATGPLNVLTSVTLSGAPFTVGAGDTLVAEAARTGDCAAPPRMRNAYSMKAYSAFNYEIAARAQMDSSGAGRSGVLQGYVLLGPKC